MKYFISYEYRSAGASYWNKYNEVIEEHPLDWLKEVYELVEKEGPKYRGEYFLVTWVALSLEEDSKVVVGEMTDMFEETEDSK